MCTLIIQSLSQPLPRLLLFANRDEILTRPSAPPSWHSQGANPYFAPQDLQGGGTWLGINRHALVLAITNRSHDPRPGPAAPSRGGIVCRLLSEMDNAEKALEFLEGADLSPYPGFNLFIGTPLQHFFFVHQRSASGVTQSSRRLGPGFHCISESSYLGSDLPPRLRKLQDELGTLDPTEPLAMQHARALLANHGGTTPFDATCLHLEAAQYGTRSSTLIDIPSPPDPVGFWHADGPPCRNAYVNLSDAYGKGPPSP